MRTVGYCKKGGVRVGDLMWRKLIPLIYKLIHTHKEVHQVRTLGYCEDRKL